jgi:hypothetical protein
MPKNESEKSSEQPPLLIKCICAFCKEEHQAGRIEINFFAKTIRSMCPKFRNVNEMEMRGGTEPLPRIRIM